MSEQTADEIEQTAVQAVADADTALADLEARVIAGEAVDPAEIERARTNRHIAELQKDGARKRADQLRADQAAARSAAAVAEARQALEGRTLGAVAEKYAAVDRALRELVDVCETRNHTIRRLHNNLSRVGGDGVEVSDSTHGKTPYVVVDGVRYASADSQPGALIRYLVQRLAADHPTKLPVPGAKSLGSTFGVTGLRRPPRAATGEY